MRASSDIAFRRLTAQRLVGKPLTSPVEVVRWMGAVQAQDYGGAKWALAMRCKPVTDAELDRLFDAGEIVRTHVMRPTWHFVAPEDIRWLLELTGPRVMAWVAGRHRQLEIDARIITRAKTAFADALSGGRHLTRPELGAALTRAKISPEGQRLPHLLLTAEVDGLIISGPRRGKQHTWMLLDERTRKTQSMDRDEAIAELTLRYFRSHGPAQLQDFAWWSGLTAADARAGLAMAAKALERTTIQEKEYFFASPLDSSTVLAGRCPSPLVGEGKGGGANPVHFLPNFDEYLVAYRDRAAALHPDRPFDPKLFAFSSILSNVLLVGGLVHGAWRRVASGKTDRLEIKLLDRLTAGEKRAVEQETHRMAAFLGRPVSLELPSSIGVIEA